MLGYTLEMCFFNFSTVQFKKQLMVWSSYFWLGALMTRVTGLSTVPWSMFHNKAALELSNEEMAQNRLSCSRAGVFSSLRLDSWMTNCESVLHVAFQAVSALIIRHTTSEWGMWQRQSAYEEKQRGKKYVTRKWKHDTSFYIKYQSCMQTSLVNHTPQTGMNALDVLDRNLTWHSF